MHRPLFLATAGGIAAVGALTAATAMPAMAATAGRAATPPVVATNNAPVVCTAPNGTTGACSPGADTPVTFSITSTGTLNITAPSGAPAAIILGSEAAPGTSTSTIIGGANDFGAVTVTDTRATNPSPWIATVSCTNFLNKTTNVAADTIPATDATYATGTVSADTPANGGVGSNLPFDTALTGATVTLSNGVKTIVSETGFDGDNAATWSPGITVAIPANAVVGTYLATVTHSVS